MAPFYRGFETRPKLKEDDIKGIQALYGKASEGNSESENEVEDVRLLEKSKLCDRPKFDAIVTVKDKTTFVFKGSKYWKLTDDGLALGYPRTISRDWEGLPSNIDAAFTWTNGKTYIFKGSKYWRFTNTDMDKGYPKLISKGFDGIPNFVDAAFVWSGKRKDLLFQGALLIS